MKKTIQTLATWLMLEEIEEKAFEGLEIDEQNKLYKELNENNIEAMKEMQESGATSEELKEALEKVEKERAEQITKIFSAIEKQGKAISKLLKSGGTTEKPSLTKEIKDNKDELKGIISGSSKEVTLKAVTNRASVTDNALGVFIPDITQLGVKERSLYNVLPKVTVSDDNNGGVVRYRDWDEATTVRAAAMIAESGTFPESTAKFRWYTQDLKKVGDTLPVTEEFFEDEAMAASELGMFLKVNVNLVIDNQLVNGDNTGNNLQGIMNSATAYVPVASGVATPNLKDLSIKVKNDITRTRGSKFKPDFLLCNSATMEDLILAKDANGNYIFNEELGTVAGLIVILDENVSDNEMCIGDRRFARIYEKTGVVMSKGTPNAQFLEDEITIKVRKRMLLLIKNGDAVGFRKVTDITAALATIAS